MKYDEKNKLIKSLNEKSFRGNVLIPLINAMGFNDARDNHGVYEKGKDIIFRSLTPWGDVEIYAAVVTMNDITGNANHDNYARRALDQIKMALSQPYTDIYTGRTSKVDRCWFVSAGNIKGASMESISGELDSLYLDRIVTFFDIDRVIQLVDKYYPQYWHRQVELAYGYKSRVYDISSNILDTPYDKPESELTNVGSLQEAVYCIKKLTYSLMIEMEFELLEKLEKILESNNPLEIYSIWEKLDSDRARLGPDCFVLGCKEIRELDKYMEYLYEDLVEYEEKHDIERKFISKLKS
ncbi:hypothetical protein [Paenibacillus validus]|uniref:Uncharacterized protein n=1 Tax=Paenibacillus validus TaxID=44253 RepID=A0A7X3CVI5_9BACL|nr:hypothetical protein [Paenibacillus validus]MUG73841.1 hypothetical protein [Paenibacillus validus]